MAQRLIVHIGSMKSGTSFVQNVLGANKDALAARGVLFPGARWRDQVAAVTDLIDLPREHGPREHGPREHGPREHGPREHGRSADPGPWQRLADEVNAWPDTAVISMEFLGPRSAGKIRQLVSSFPGTDLHVVLTGRDLMRNVPAMWLESVQNGSVVTWPEFLEAVRAERDQPGPDRYFWKHQGLAAIARRWVKVVGPDHFTLVTVPPRGAPPGLLWQRVAGLIGIDPGGWDLDVRGNPSIGAATAMVLRRLNESLTDHGARPPGHDFYVKHVLAKRGLATRHRAEPVLGFDADWAIRRGAEEVQRLRAQRLRVVGDLDELLPRPVPGVHTDDVGLEDQLAASVDGLAHLVRSWSAADKAHRRSLRRARSGRS